MAVPTASAQVTERPLHSRPFQLRFSTQRVLGRSYESAVRPRALGATLTAKFYSVVETATNVELEELTNQAEHKVAELLTCAPEPPHKSITTSQEYGQWTNVGRNWNAPWWDRRLHYHIRDSAWLKSRVAILAADGRR